MSFLTHFKNKLNGKGDEMESEGSEMIDGLRNMCERIQKPHTHLSSFNQFETPNTVLEISSNEGREWGSDCKHAETS